MSTFQGEDQFDTALLMTMCEELQALKTKTDERFQGLENAVKMLAEDVKKLVVLRSAGSKPQRDEGQSEARMASEETQASTVPAVDIEDVSSSWNYLIAKKGGYNHLLYLTVQELLELGENGVSFLAFLAQKRTIEVQHRLQQLQAEYQKLQGNQLQEHFRELWKSHYMLLKNKQARTWKEEIFLAAFDAFIAWIQT